MTSKKIDPYLECISMRGQQVADAKEEQQERCDQIKPSVSILDEQQVSAIAVIERCKSNYQQKQWDVGTWLLYDTARAQEAIPVILPPVDSTDAVGKCLLRAESNHESNLACMSDYLGETYPRESGSAVFWRYEKVHHKIFTNVSDDVDACIVFSGPAKKNDTSATTVEFRRCSHDYTDTGCVIPHMVWSSSSPNKIPVATLHAVEEVTPEDREENALTLFAEAREMAMGALEKLENFTDANLEVVLFSGEGDALHQVRESNICFSSLLRITPKCTNKNRSSTASSWVPWHASTSGTGDDVHISCTASLSSTKARAVAYSCMLSSSASTLSLPARSTITFFTCSVLMFRGIESPKTVAPASHVTFCHSKSSSKPLKKLLMYGLCSEKPIHAPESLTIHTFSSQVISTWVISALSLYKPKKAFMVGVSATSIACMRRWT